ncbi:MAG: DUF499 domain-containing protein [Planctomycetia bacterium]|nr:DUF499 domain-containing protein [Planctomycetia bacterium]
MLGLKLREEFRGKRLKGTAIELENEKKTGATQVPAQDFLAITYPTADVVTAIEAIGPGHSQPVTLIGERGQGKSHLLAALHHVLRSPDVAEAWLKEWSDRLAQPKLADIALRPQTHVISESLHRQNYKFLWDILFDRHPRGEYVKGMWENDKNKTDVPGQNHLLALFKHTPTVLIFDEFQTWFDGLTNTKQYPWRTWAFNFIQLLSEIASEHPEYLVLVVSVRSGDTDAYRQIHRINPVRIDFKGPNARRDRLRLLLHRLFENRLQVPEANIWPIIGVHLRESLRLADVPPADQERTKRDFVEAWPFSPFLMTLLEDQVLVATQAQETRDLIRILADVFKAHGETSPVLTAADIRLDDEKSGIAALLDSVANQSYATLREKAQRNLSAVRDAVKSVEQAVPHLAEVVGALWLRSLAIKNAGAEPAQLQADVTRDRAVDDNAFQAEMATIVENSFNIHVEGTRLVFREEENPQAKLMSSARNDKLFPAGEDKIQLAREIRYVIGGGDAVAKAFRVIALPSSWSSDPWTGLEEADQPSNWDERIPILVLPEAPERIHQLLGNWLRTHLQTRRNAVRFLLPEEGAESLYFERDLIVLARAVLLADKWKVTAPDYKKLHQRYEGELRGILKKRFPRYGILGTWNFQEPGRCSFHIEPHKAEGGQIPDAVDKLINDNLFIPEEFEPLVLSAAEQNESLGKFLSELQEPRPAGAECIAWLGETLMKERLLRLCAQGRIAINLRGAEYLQAKPGESEDNAWRRMKGRLPGGRALMEVHIIQPQAVPGADGVGPVPPVVGPQPGGGQPVLPGQPVTGGPAPTVPVPGGGQGALFGGGVRLLPCATSAPTSALNLLGKVEGWGVNSGTQIRDLSLKIPNLTGAQLNDLLKKLPDGMTYDLSLNKEER